MQKISSLMQLKFQLNRLKVENVKLFEYKQDLLKDFSKVIEVSRVFFASMEKNCSHIVNELSSDIVNIIEEDEKIKENAAKIAIEPRDHGKWINWQSDLFLEEKLFPKLFLFGIGGFLSSNMLKNNHMGYTK